MAYRHIFIERPAKLSLKNSQLVIESEKSVTVPIEDISTLLIENRQVSVSAAVLSRLGQDGCAVFICDDKHLPCAVLTPFAEHSRELSVIKSQLEVPEPLKKRLWQSILRAKITNQALCLAYNGKTDEAAALNAMTAKVRSGDSGNTEAAAAGRYFPALFDPGFTRRSEDVTNAALNYGYAILRGCISRDLAAYGFLPALGLHHRSALNNFNLADDLIEPFRPIVDLMVATQEEFRTEAFTPDCKKFLFSVLALEINSGGQGHAVAYAIERLVKSLTRSLAEGENRLLLPKLVPLKLHSYE